MFRRTAAALFILPNAGGNPALPPFLTKNDAHVHPFSGDLYEFVLEYDHKEPMPHYFRGTGNYHGNSFAIRWFSGSPVAAATTLAGAFLFAFTYGYNVANPVIDAHHELWAKQLRATAGHDDKDEDDAEGGPIEEEGDDVEAEGDIIVLESEEAVV